MNCDLCIANSNNFDAMIPAVDLAEESGSGVSSSDSVARAAGWVSSSLIFWRATSNEEQTTSRAINMDSITEHSLQQSFT